MISSPSGQQELLAAARAGDHEAFRYLVEPHRGALQAHCYRMLGSLHDAEDALQETLLRAWRGLSGFNERSRIDTWLYRIATNVCLDAIAHRARRVLPIDYGPPVESGADAPHAPLDAALWIDPYPGEVLGVPDGFTGPEARYEQRESIELAFIAALQNIPPRPRAVLILRDVLGFSAKEVAALLATTVAAVNSALQRARNFVDDRLPERSQQATIRALGDDRVSALTARFVDAFERADVDAIVQLLAKDATFEMPPYQSWYRGREAIADSWLMPGESPGRLRYEPTRANGQVAMGAYALERGAFAPIALDVLTLRGSEVAAVVAFRAPELFRAFGLPAELRA